jgi:hypothetical protein
VDNTADHAVSVLRSTVWVKQSQCCGQQHRLCNLCHVGNIADHALHMMWATMQIMQSLCCGQQRRSCTLCAVGNGTDHVTCVRRSKVQVMQSLCSLCCGRQCNLCYLCGVGNMVNLWATWDTLLCLHEPEAPTSYDYHWCSLALTCMPFPSSIFHIVKSCNLCTVSNKAY